MKSPGVSPHFLSATLFLAAVALAAPTLAATAMDALPAAPETMVVPRLSAPAAPTGAPSEKLKKYDRDGDGLLDAAEFAAAQRALRAEAGLAGPATAAEAAAALRRRVFEQFDLDGDGRLDDTERTAAQTAVANGSLLRSPELREEILERFDRNENNRLDPDERTAMAAFFRELRGTAPAAAAPAKAESKAEAKAEAKREKKAAAAAVTADAAVPVAAADASGPGKKEKIAGELTKRRQASVEAAARAGDKP